jgi:feruloyl esterase
MAQYLKVAKIVAELKKSLSKSQMEALSQTVLAPCDAAAGIADGAIEEPPQCKFDPPELLCKGALDGKCLSEIQVEASREIHDDIRDARTHALAVGPASANNGLPATLTRFFGADCWPYMVYGDPKLDLSKLDFLQACKELCSRTGSLLNSVDPELSAVRTAGKKIIQYRRNGPILRSQPNIGLPL